MKIITDDCLNAVKAFESESIDCIITDPPYGLSFMGSEVEYKQYDLFEKVSI